MADCAVGRLVEAGFESLPTVGDVTAFQKAMLAAFAKAGPNAVICADWRSADLLAPDVADALIELLKRGNRHFERSAVLLSAAHATFNLQVERLVRQAGNPARRTFRDPERMLVWLGEILRLDELYRARSFLGGAAEEARS
jgi:hypothetical protein